MDYLDLTVLRVRTSHINRQIPYIFHLFVFMCVLQVTKETWDDLEFEVRLINQEWV